MDLSPGYTAIVGPNGSGKSNILDAIRWVLGDSSSNRLRISRQSDLSFQGSISLKPANEVQVALRVVHPDRNSEISRSYQPDSGTQVIVDGARVRLSDLDDLKREWKLGTDQFAFISQGEVADAIRQRGFQRRLQLEILFGIDQYRKNRDEADSKVKETTEELLRLQALLSELASRQRKIEPEVVKAEKAAVIQVQLNKARKDYYFLKRSVIHTRIDDLENKLAFTYQKLQQGHTWVNIWSRSVHSTQEELASLSSRLQILEQEESRFSRERDNFLKQAFSEANSRKGCLEKKRSLKQEISEKDKEIAGIEKDLADYFSKRSELEGELSRLENEHDEVNNSVLLLEKELEADLLRRNHLVKELSEVEIDIKTDRLRILGTIQKIRELKSYLSEMETRSEQVHKDMQANRICIETKGEELSGIMEDHTISYTSCQNLASQIQRIRKEASVLESRYEQLKVSTEDEVYPEGVRFLLSAYRLGRSGSVTPVVETFKISPEFTTALDAYLGARVFWLVVSSMKEARSCIEMLKKNEKGRVTFLPLERCRPRKPHRKILATEGTMGWAIDLMDIQPSYKKALEHLLGDLLIVRTFESARPHLSGTCSFPIVTLEGEVFAPSGTITGGRQKKGPGIIQRRQERESICERIAESGSKLTQIRELLELEEAREKKLSSRKEDLSLAMSRLEREKGSLEIESDQLRAKMDDLLKKISRTQKELSGLLEERKSTINRRREITISLENITQGDRLHELQLKKGNLENTIRLVREKHNSAKQIGIRIEGELERAKESTLILSKQLSQTNLEIVEQDNRLQRLGKLAYSKWVEINRRQQELKEITEYFSIKKKSGSRKELRYQLAREALTSLQTTRDIIEQQKNSVENELEQLVETWSSTFPESDQEGLSDKDIETLSAEIHTCERSLKRLGEYDPGALSENQSLKERISFLRDQIQDVRNGLEELGEIIASADRQVDQVFKRALTNIDLRFNSLFKRLFGGGEAHLQLDNSENTSLWDEGVDILARPPGKRLQNLAQLSGGEQSLTAISLLFACMEVAEVPVAILDEVDAALDEVNLRRFVNLIMEYSRTIQLMIMTHRRFTMEKADIMYGVTMPEPGLSKIVGVKLEDWK